MHLIKNKVRKPNLFSVTNIQVLISISIQKERLRLDNCKNDYVEDNDCNDYIFVEFETPNDNEYIFV